MGYVAALLLIADGLSTMAVTAMPGHALTSTTLDKYAHDHSGAVRLTADAMERLLRKAEKTGDHA